MNLAFDPATEHERFLARKGFLARQAGLRLDLADKELQLTSGGFFIAQ